MWSFGSLQPPNLGFRFADRGGDAGRAAWRISSRLSRLGGESLLSGAVFCSSCLKLYSPVSIEGGPFVGVLVIRALLLGGLNSGP